ncbi:DUF655 domain-containing protein [Candidatus Bathyarchaeota archaeon]|nr:MAG: DUF655 domain-containing protein [Candidatus Bathyarchaeota archaeon]
MDFMMREVRAGRRRATGPVVQLVGEEYFTLLEAVAKIGVELKPQDRIYIGRNEREHIAYIIGRVRYDELTAAAKAELPIAVETIIIRNEKRFVEFFNTAGPLTPRLHALELLPGIGKRYMWLIVEERAKKPFESFEDLQKRTGLPNPVKIIARRVLDELIQDTRYRLFTRPP